MLTNIDVTLRDGGYRNNFCFPMGYALAHAKSSVRAGLEWVEIAYRNGSFASIQDLGLTGRGDDEYIRVVANEIGPDRVGLIVHPKNINEDDLRSVYDAGARLIRICIDARSPKDGFETLQNAKKLGFTAAINFTRVTRQDRARLAHAAAEAAQRGADVVYLADSNGSLIPDETERMVAALASVVDCPIGIHAHNNLGLALANSIAAVESGATWVDSSVLGMGKGPGNLPTEHWIAYLLRRYPHAEYDLGEAIMLAELLAASVVESAPELPLPDLLLGWFDLPVEHRSQVVGSCAEDRFATAVELARVASAS